MDCKEAIQHITELVDNRIEKDKKIEVEKHLKECPRCRAEFRLEKKTKEIVSTRIKRVPVPPELRERILSQIYAFQDGYSARAKAKKRTWFSLELSLAFGLAVIVIAIFIVLSLTQKANLQNSALASISPILTQYRAVSRGELKPDIISGDLNVIISAVQKEVHFTPMIMDIPNFQLVGVRISKTKPPNCADRIYRNKDKFIYIHQSPYHLTRWHKSVVSEVKHGKWLYLTTDSGESVIMWGDKDIACCAVSNLDLKELVKILKINMHEQ